MNARNNDLSRIQEIHDIIMQTQRQLHELSFTRERFTSPACSADDLIAEGLMNRVFRAMEEAGSLSPDASELYGFDTRGIKGVRNRLAHAYGEVDRDVIWSVIQEDFPALLASCHAYCGEVGVDLR